MGRVWPRHNGRSSAAQQVVSHQFARMGRTSAIAYVVIASFPFAAAVALAILVPVASHAPRLWGVVGIALSVVGYAAFARAKLSVLRTHGPWTWGAEGMSRASRKLYWAGYTMMAASVIIVLAAAIAVTLIRGQN